MRRRALGLLALTLVLTGAAPQGAMEVRSVSSGRTRDGRPWFAVQLRGAYPPRGLDSWYVAVAVQSRGREYRSVVRGQGRDVAAQLTDERGRALARPRVWALEDGGALVVLPVKVGAGARYVLLTGQRGTPGGAVRRWSRGSAVSPLRLGARRVDPRSAFAIASPKAAPPAAVPSEAPPPRALPPVPEGDPSFPSAAAMLLGAGLGAALLFSSRRAPASGRHLRAAVVIAATGAGALLGMAADLGSTAGAAVGLLAAVVLVLRPAGRAVR